MILQLAIATSMPKSSMEESYFCKRIIHHNLGKLEYILIRMCAINRSSPGKENKMRYESYRFRYAHRLFKRRSICASLFPHRQRFANSFPCIHRHRKAMEPYRLVPQHDEAKTRWSGSTERNNGYASQSVGSATNRHQRENGAQHQQLLDSFEPFITEIMTGVVHWGCD